MLPPNYFYWFRLDLIKPSNLNILKVILWSHPLWATLLLTVCPKNDVFLESEMLSRERTFYAIFILETYFISIVLITTRKKCCPGF